MNDPIETLRSDLNSFGDRRRTGLTPDLLATVPAHWRGAYRALIQEVAGAIHGSGRDHGMVEFCRSHPALGPSVADSFVDSDLAHTVACFDNVVRLDEHLSAEDRLAVESAILAHDAQYPAVDDFQAANVRDLHQLLGAGAFFRMADAVERRIGTSIWYMAVRGKVGTIIAIHDWPSTHQPFPADHPLIALLHVHRIADRLDMLGSFGKELARALKKNRGPMDDLPRRTLAHIVVRYVEEAIEGGWHGPNLPTGLPTFFITPNSWDMFCEKLDGVLARYGISRAALNETIEEEIRQSKIAALALKEGRLQR